jgi:ribonuclease HII
VAVGHHRIAQLNILNASLLAMRLACTRVLHKLGQHCEDVDIILVDGNKEIPFARGPGRIPPQRAVVHGDRLCAQIAAASILAKVSRDAQMAVLESKYPGYGFSAHAGYPTKSHREAIKQIGPSPIHRRSFSGVAEHLES